MSLLGSAFPAWDKLRVPVTRDQAMLLIAAVNELFLGVDIYIAHVSNGNLKPQEWIPVIFGLAAGALLLAGWVARRRRLVANVLASVVFAASLAVGAAGAYFHIVRAFLPHAAPGSQVTVDLLVWGPPVLAPLMFCMVGILGLSAAWQEDPPESGRLRLLGGVRLQMPYSKTRAYLILVSLGILITVLSSVLDHARTQFEDAWLWLPTAAGACAAVAAGWLAAASRPSPTDIRTHVAFLLTLIAIGTVGAALHIQGNLTAQGTIVGERFLRWAPFLAPLLFCNVGLIGLVAVWTADEAGP